MSKKIKHVLKLLALVLFLILIGNIYLTLTTAPIICPRVERIFLNQKYDVERCGGGGGDLHYFMRMRIYSKNGELLAQRRYTVSIPSGSEKTEYWDDKIVYNDAIRDGEPGVPAIESKTLQFPLTRKDWFEANWDRILFSP